MSVAQQRGCSKLSDTRLSALVEFYAQQYRDGSYPYVRFTEPERWHQRLYRDPRVDVWLISWLPTQGTELHDHGQSAGSLAVLRGELTEYVPSGWSDAQMWLRSTSHRAGSRASFARHHIHDVVNHGSAPAVSLHAYSPPLTTMTFYDIVAGELTTSRTLATSDPEPMPADTMIVPAISVETPKARRAS